MEQEKNSQKSFNAVLEEKKSDFKNLKKETKTAVYIGTGGVVLASLFSAGYMAKNKYDVLFTGLDDVDASNIVEQLEEDNIDVKIEGSTIYVPKKEVDRLRLELSSTITNGSQGFELMDSSSGFGMTEEEFQLKKQRMIQGEIEKTIKTFPQVESARVHITPGEQSVFAKQATSGKAAVYVNLKAGRKLEETQVASIVSLVSASSYNIPKQNIEVIDQNMTLLSEGMFSEDGSYSSGKNLSELDTARKAEKEYNEDLKASLKELLEPIFGSGKVKISVNTDLNFDTEDKKVLVVDPNRVAIKEHKTENLTSEGGESGSPVDNNMSAPTVADGESSEAREEDTEYITGQSETVTSVAKGGIRNISTSVVIDGIQDEETLEMVEQMVQTVVGYNPNRGDKVSVISMQFSNELEEAEKERLEKEKKEAITKMAIVTGGSLGTIALVALIITIINKKRRKAIERGEMSSNSPVTDDMISSAIAEVEGTINGLKESSVFNEDKSHQSLDDEIREFANKNPEQTVELLKIWLNE